MKQTNNELRNNPCAEYVSYSKLNETALVSKILVPRVSKI